VRGSGAALRLGPARVGGGRRGGGGGGSPPAPAFQAGPLSRFATAPQRGSRGVAKESRMSLKVAVQMDPLEGINIEGDTTFLMMLTAQARGHSLFVYTPDTLALEDGRITARGRPV